MVALKLTEAVMFREKNLKVGQATKNRVQMMN